MLCVIMYSMMCLLLCAALCDIKYGMMRVIVFCIVSYIFACAMLRVIKFGNFVFYVVCCVVSQTPHIVQHISVINNKHIPMDAERSDDDSEDNKPILNSLLVMAAGLTGSNISKKNKTKYKRKRQPKEEEKSQGTSKKKAKKIVGNHQTETK